MPCVGADDAISEILRRSEASGDIRIHPDGADDAISEILRRRRRPVRSLGRSDGADDAISEILRRFEERAAQVRRRKAQTTRFQKS